MTKDKFFKVLEKHGKNRFNIGKYTNTLRTTYNGYCCPITFVCNITKDKNYSISEWHTAASDLGLNPILARKITKSADF